jgi:hypothetical protein
MNRLEAQQLQNYLRLKNIKDGFQTDGVEEPSINIANNIEDEKKNWLIKSSSNGNVITLNSLLWPGYICYVKPNTNTFGSVYMGTGQKNLDMEFIF